MAQQTSDSAASLVEPTAKHYCEWIEIINSLYATFPGPDIPERLLVSTKYAVTINEMHASL